MPRRFIPGVMMRKESVFLPFNPRIKDIRDFQATRIRDIHNFFSLIIDVLDLNKGLLHKVIILSPNLKVGKEPIFGPGNAAELCKKCFKEKVGLSKRPHRRI